MGWAVKAISKFNYADYITWSDSERWEIIDGIPYNMSPAPNRKHQEVAGNLYGIFKNYFKNKKCKLFIAPFDVVLSEESEDVLIENVVQPDISVFCDTKKLNDKGAKGAPDFVCEILSPATRDKDFGVKAHLYMKYGVKEYWIIDPDSKTVYTTFLNKDNRFEEWITIQNSSLVSSKLFEGMHVKFEDLFDF